ncbi:MAG: hypothetical protein GXO43_02610 [Crenarchaeota archaeon]|nr:hypothetical protein [Thermoproteota archaeon]
MIENLRRLLGSSLIDLSKVGESSPLLDYLLRLKLLKSYVIALLSSYKIPTPHTILIVDYDEAAIRDVVRTLGLPLLVRFDYTEFTTDKPVGGILIYNYDALLKLVRNSAQKHIYVLLSEPFSRFQNVYSANCLLTRGGNEIVIEVVGRGFDLKDLRHGNIKPHEVMIIDITTGTVISRNIIGEEEYRKSIEYRIDKVKKILTYEKLVNIEGRPLSLKELLSLKPPGNIYQSSTGKGLEIPERYTEMPHNVIEEMVSLLKEINSKVVPRLPRSKTYVVSMSYIKRRGWIVWDIYGGWYLR